MINYIFVITCGDFQHYVKVEEKIKENTKMIWIETPIYSSLLIADLNQEFEKLN